MQTTKGKLRNITSLILHTKMDDIYTFFEEYTGENGIMTHHLPSAAEAIQPILRNKNLPEEYFIKKHITEGLDEPVELPDLTPEERKQFFDKFGELVTKVWDKIGSKTVHVNIDNLKETQ